VRDIVLNIANVNSALCSVSQGNQGKSYIVAVVASLGKIFDNLRHLKKNLIKILVILVELFSRKES
jgi:hypothetical protein